MELSLLVVSSFAEVADVVDDGNSTAVKSEGQRSRFLIPTTPSSLTYSCTDSIMILLSAYLVKIEASKARLYKDCIDWLKT